MWGCHGHVAEQDDALGWIGIRRYRGVASVVGWTLGNVSWKSQHLHGVSFQEGETLELSVPVV